uniref:Uncharacterized protein n=1 Tax=Oryza sativa subsp. japonica TaxID=39947 RepID=Q5Z920_ORYSJ|nr:hypothetical protein [Oryza sativa Japonica Group]
MTMVISTNGKWTVTERGAPHRETAQAPLCRFGRGLRVMIPSSLCLWKDRDLSKEHEAQAMYTGSGR